MDFSFIYTLKVEIDKCHESILLKKTVHRKLFVSIKFISVSHMKGHSSFQVALYFTKEGKVIL